MKSKKARPSMAKQQVARDKPKDKSRDKQRPAQANPSSITRSFKENREKPRNERERRNSDDSNLSQSHSDTSQKTGKPRKADKATDSAQGAVGMTLPFDRATIFDALSSTKIVKVEGERPKELAPLILETLADNDYALLDSGNGLKLERYGPYKIIRPEGQALWQPSLDVKEWEQADAIFTGNTDEEGLGRWNFPKTPLGETWPMAWNGMSFLGRFTSFRHVGVFPEQDAHWRFMEKQIIDAKRPVKVLNLFGYTGVASLIAARAGAEVTHVDASKKAIGWARENQEIAGLNDKPIRWICEDAMKFVEREARRGKTYDIILLDPPAYGRGPNGEVWQLFDHLPQMVSGCRDILSDKPLAVVLTAYSIRASFYAIHELMRDRFRGLKGQVQSGELILREEQAKRALSTSLFSRWIA